MSLPFFRERDLDARIRSLRNREMIRNLNGKQLSAYEFRQLAELYLQKGETRKAIAYFYKAADAFSVEHPTKSVALYKKILACDASETSACEKIVAMLSREGLVAEQVKYLTLMARYHDQRNDVERTAAVFRRILDLDPGNETARLFFSRGKKER